MPHKHRRKRGEDDNFDLPPSQRALPLSVSSRSQNRSTTDIRSKENTGHIEKATMPPRAFKRKRLRPGLDNGDSARNGPKNSGTPVEVPRIKPGEDMRSFSARVDTALPVAGLTKKTKTKDGKDSLGIKVQRTRKERKMQSSTISGRAEERKIPEQKEEERELAAERELEK
ncbi:hypothetical protein J3459_013804 [Metarhizium acridum]|nr:hypothetical protein J3459_013804 [Metarhizium acridum]